jgi:hypothetical protein
VFARYVFPSSMQSISESLRFQFQTNMVPMPSSVSISIRMECGMRPSMMNTRFARRASDGVGAALGLGDHAAGDDAVADELVCLALGRCR